MNYPQFSEELFQKAQARASMLLKSKHVNEIETEVLSIIEALDGRSKDYKSLKFTEWSVPELLSAQGRLASLRVNLGQLAAEAQSKTNLNTRFMIYQKSKAWKPVKSKLEEEADKTGSKFVKADVENVLIEAFWETQQTEVFNQEIADKLVSLYESTNQVLTSLKMMINFKQNEQREAKYFDSLSQKED